MWAGWSSCQTTSTAVLNGDGREDSNGVSHADNHEVSRVAEHAVDHNVRYGVGHGVGREVDLFMSCGLVQSSEILRWQCRYI